MKQRFRPASLVPSGLMVDGIAIGGDRVVVRVRAAVDARPCPDCGAISRRIQSRYWRRAKDLPLSSRRVELHVLVGRYRCDAVARSSQSAFVIVPSRHGYTGRIVSIVSSSISAPHWAADLERVLPLG